MVTYKSTAIERMLSADSSGRLRELYNDLIGLGLKTKISKNTETLLFEAITPSKERVGIVAMRSGVADIFSLPRAYWIRLAPEVDAALSSIGSRHFIETQGFVSSSQYSLRQVRISGDTSLQLKQFIKELVATQIAKLCNPI